MKIIKFEKKDIDILVKVLKGLFSEEYHDITAKETSSGVNIVFHKESNRALNVLFPMYSKIEKSLFELLWKEIPLRLSYRRAGNKSFTYIYLLGITRIMMEDPSLLIKYLERKYKEIHTPYEKDIDLVMMDIENLEKVGQQAFSAKKLFDTIAVVSDENPDMANFVDFLGHK